MTADPIRVERIVTNLFSTAHKFTPAGDSITVDIYSDEDSRFIRISDTGDGVPSEEHELVFSPYYRSANADGRQHGGTGFDLIIARYLAELYGGSLDLTGELGEGSVFTLRPPISAGIPQHAGAYRRERVFSHWPVDSRLTRWLLFRRMRRSL